MSDFTKVEQLGRDGFIWWIGQVENKEDPAKLGRVKVRIAGWYTGKQYKDKLPSKDLPWAHVLQPSNSGGVKNTGDSANQLEVGAIVLGFFMDGESAQQPCVLGLFRANISEGKKDGEWIGDLRPPDDMGGTEDHVYNRYPAAVSREGDGSGNNNINVHGADTGISGATSVAGVAPGGNAPQSDANSAGVPNPTPQPASQGFDGPGKTLIKDLKWLVTDLGTTAGAVVPNPKGQGFISAINGSLVNMQTLIDKIKQFISYAIQGITVDLKLVLMRAIQIVIDAIQKAFAGLPVVVQVIIQVVLKLLQKFLCLNFPDFDSLLATVTGMLTSMIDQLIGKITQALSSALNAINSTICTIVESIAKAISFVSSVFSTIASAIQAVKVANDAAKSAFKLLEFNKLNWTNISSLIFMLIDLLPNNCGDRVEGNDGKSDWVPLYGAANESCDLAALGFSSDNIAGGQGGCGGSGGGGGGGSSNPYQKFFDVDPYSTYIKSYPNGAFEIVNNDPKKACIRRAQPNGSGAVLMDGEGNIHTHQQGNETKIISKDSCERVKGKKIITVDGDFCIKVNGNFHIEVAGAKYDFSSQGKDLKKGKHVKGKETTCDEKEQELKGNKIESVGGKITYSTLSEMELNASTIRLKAGTISQEAGSEIGLSAKTITNYAGCAEWNFIGLDPITPGTRGQFNQIFGLRTTTMLPAIPYVPTPVDTYIMATPGVVLKNITGTWTQNITGPETRNTTGAFTKQVTGKSTWNTTGAKTITAQGPLILAGTPILLN